MKREWALGGSEYISISAKWLFNSCLGVISSQPFLFLVKINLCWIDKEEILEINRLRVYFFNVSFNVTLLWSLPLILLTLTFDNDFFGLDEQVDRESGVLVSIGFSCLSLVYVQGTYELLVLLKSANELMSNMTAARIIRLMGDNIDASVINNSFVMIYWSFIW